MGQLENMRLFVTIVEAGSLSKAAQCLNIAKSAVSKRLSDLEAGLGCQLLIRTTRQSNLTEEGQTYFRRAEQILTEVDDLNAGLSESNTELSGKIKMSLPFSFGHQHITPALMEFMELHPQLEIDIEFSDRKIDLIEGGFDLAVRIGELDDSNIVAKKICPIRVLVAASEDYLEQHGLPLNPNMLKTHNLLQYQYSRNSKANFIGPDDESYSIAIEGNLNANSGEFLKLAAIAGKGITFAPSFMIWQELAEGSLVQILKDYTRSKINAYVVYPPTKHLPLRTRTFIDFLAERFGNNPYWDQAIGYNL